MTGPALDPRRRRALEQRTRTVAAVHVEDSSPTTLPAQRSPLVDTSARPATPPPPAAPASSSGAHRRVGRDADDPTSALWVSRADVRRARRRRLVRRVVVVALVAASTVVLILAGSAWLVS